MSKDEWYSKLNKWAHEDSRLERMPLVYLRVLAEHIANEQAVEQSVQRTATLEPVCTCKVTVDSYNNCDAHGARRR